MTSARDALRTATDYLAASGVEDASAEAVRLLSAAARIPAETILIEDPPVSADAMRAFNRWIARRGEAREPFAYITGTAAFLDFEVHVTPSVLIPRPSTECLAEEAFTVPARTAADIGTGSGVLAIALARRRPDLRVVATDVSEKALAVADRNAGRLGVSDRIEFRRGSLYEPLDEPVDLIVSNPPYVKRHELATLQPEVRHEPEAALDGGPDGLDALRPLLAGAPDRLTPGGTLAAEFGYDQSDEVRTLAEKAGFSRIEIHPDLDGIDRVLLAVRD